MSWLNEAEVVMPEEKRQRQFEARYAAWKRERAERVAVIEVEHNGVVYQGDEDSQTRLARAIVALPDDKTTTLWIAKDNSEHYLTRPELQAILQAAGRRQSEIWNEGRPAL